MVATLVKWLFPTLILVFNKFFVDQIDSAIWNMKGYSTALNIIPTENSISHNRWMFICDENLLFIYKLLAL